MSKHECIEVKELEEWANLEGEKQTEIILKINSCAMCKRKWLKYWAEAHPKKSAVVSV